MTKSITVNSMVAVAMIGAMVLSVFAFATPASAAINSSSFTITTTNRGTIDNSTTADARTGYNTAHGSTGGAGGNAGNVLGGAGNNNGGATSGDGGNGGNADDGGLIETGNATAEAGTENALNTTDVDVDLTSAAEDVNSTSLNVVTNNDIPSDTDPCDCVNNIDNDTDADARTGRNTADGSLGGAAGTGGALDGQTGTFNNGGADAGDAGNGGLSGFGGTVRTGNASSTAGTINMLNTAFVRVRI